MSNIGLTIWGKEVLKLFTSVVFSFSVVKDHASCLLLSIAVSDINSVKEGQYVVVGQEHVVTRRILGSMDVCVYDVASMEC